MRPLVLKSLQVAILAGSLARVATQSTSTSDSGSGYLSGNDEDNGDQVESVSECGACPRCGTLMVLYGIYPCYPKYEVTPDCDIFLYISAQISRKFWTQASSVRPCITLVVIPQYWKVKLDPDADDPDGPKPPIFNLESLPAADSWIIDELQRISYITGIPPQGFIGPSSSYATQISSQVRRNYDTQFISYSSPTALLDGEDDLYTMAASVHFLNKVRLELLMEHKWYRFAIVASSDESYSLDAERLFDMANDSDVGFQVHFPGSYTGSPDVILKQLEENDIRIFIGMVGARDARNLLCSAYHFNLTTKFHVWILPGFVNPMWWNSSFASPGDRYCTDDQMISAINSTLFVDVPVVPPYNISSVDPAFEDSIFYYDIVGELIINTVLTESRSGPDGKTSEIYADTIYQYFYHSRVLNNIDCVLALERIWNHTYSKFCADMEKNNMTKEEFCDSVMDTQLPGDPSSLFKEMFKSHLRDAVFCGLSGVHILDLKRSKEYGQGMITQFGGLGSPEECLIGVYSNFNYTQEQCAKSYLNISELDLSSVDDFTFETAAESSIPNTVIPFCTGYTWKGRDGAPTDGGCRGDSCKCYSQVGMAAWITSGVVAVGGVIISIVLLIFNLVYRTNKHLKASSPRFNIIVIIACILIYPVPFLISVEFSGNQLIRDVNQTKFIFPILCESHKWMYFSGITLIIGTLFVRNWRLYRIFYNRKIQEQRFLSDKALLSVLVCIMFPVVVLLILWSALDGYYYHYEEILYPCPNLGDVDDSVRTFLVVISCGSSYNYIWETLIIFYTLALSLGVFFLAYQNSKVKSHIAQEGEFTAKVMLIALAFLLPTYIIVLMINRLYDSTNSSTLDQPSILFWSDLVFVLVFASTVLGALFIPKVIYMRRDKLEKKRKLTRLKTKKRLSNVLETKISEINKLKMGLEMREQWINSVRSSISRRMTGISVSSVSSVSTAWGSFDDKTRLTRIGSLSKSSSNTPPATPQFQFSSIPRNSLDDVFK